MQKILNENNYNYLNNFLTQSNELFSEMEEFAQKNKIPILEKSAAEFLEQLILIKNPKRVLEIGTAIAYSSIIIARLVEEESFVDTIELSKDNIKLANKFIERAGLTNKINLLEGNALEIIPHLKNEYDFIFLDADKEDYSTFLKLLVPKLKKEGILLVDNLLWKGYAAEKKDELIPLKFKNSTEIIRKFNKEFIELSGFKTTILPISDGLGLTIKL